MRKHEPQYPIYATGQQVEVLWAVNASRGVILADMPQSVAPTPDLYRVQLDGHRAPAIVHAKYLRAMEQPEPWANGQASGSGPYITPESNAAAAVVAALFPAGWA